MPPVDPQTPISPKPVSEVTPTTQVTSEPAAPAASTVQTPTITSTQVDAANAMATPASTPAPAPVSAPLPTPAYGVTPSGPTASTGAASLGQFVASQAVDVDELKKQAMLAMEGEAGRRQRELEEQKRREQEARQKLETEKAALEVKLNEILKQKEVLELEWVKYNNQKQPLENQVQPIKTEEKSSEDEERKAEQEEAIAASTPGTPVAKIQEVELRRWAVQEKRHHAEEQKWAFELKIEQLKNSMDALGGSYRKILSDEDTIRKSIREAESALKNLGSLSQLGSNS